MEREELLEILAKAYEKRGGFQHEADLARADSELMIPVIDAMTEVSNRQWSAGYKQGKDDPDFDNSPE